MSRRSVALIGLLIATALLLSGCFSLWARSWRSCTDEELLPPSPGPEEDMPRRESGGIWMEALGIEPASLDPAHVVTLDEGRVASIIYSGLTRHCSDGRILPDLAETWQVHRNGLQFTFHLRRDVTFSNGRRFTAEDVIFSFMRLLSPQTESPRSWVLEDILGAPEYAAGSSSHVAGLAAEDEYTVVVTLQEPRADFLHRLAMPAAFILSRETVETYKTMTDSAGGVPGFFAVGTGPFYIEDHREGEYLQLMRNPAYHGVGPYLDAVRFVFDVDTATARAMFADGQLSTVRVSPQEVEEVGVEVMQSVQPAVYYLGLNNQNGPTADVRVRQALNMAVDRDRILGDIIPGGYVLAHGCIPPSVPGHNPELEGYPRDIEKAGQLLSEAGYSGGFELDLVRGGSSRVLEVTDAIAQQLSEASVEVHTVTAGAGELFSLLSDADGIDAFYLSWWADYPDPGSFLFPLFHSSNWGDAGNRVRFSDRQVDTLLNAFAAVLHDEDRRYQMCREIEELVFSQAPWIPMYFPVTHRAVQPFVREYRVEGVYTSRRFDTVWFDKIE